MNTSTFASMMPDTALVDTIAAAFDMPPSSDTAHVIRACFCALVSRTGSQQAREIVYGTFDANRHGQRRLFYFEMLLEEAEDDLGLHAPMALEDAGRVVADPGTQE